MPDRRKPPQRDGGPAEAASHIAEALVDLARLARRHRLDTLGYLLDMALTEAKQLAGSSVKRS